MKIAIVGSGISGLGAAYLLQDKHEITLYEKASYVGGHSRTRDVKTPEGTVAVDTGFIVFNKRNYPNLTALFDLLEVPVARSRMSFGISIDNGWLEYGTQDLLKVFAQRRNLVRKDFLQMVQDILRFNKRAKDFVEAHPHARMEECLSKLGMRDWFIRYYLLAMGGAIWSTPLKQMLDFPAKTLVQFFDNHGLLTVSDQPQWYTTQGGSREYVTRLTEGFREKIRLNCPIARVERSSDAVHITDHHGQTQEYDHVILACHSDEALQLISAPTRREKVVLGNIRYQSNRVVLHSDTNFMPKRKSAWSSWVYLSNMRENQEPSVSLSYWMNNLQPLGTEYPILVTLNPEETPRPDLLYNDHVFEHPVFDASAIAAQQDIEAIQGVGGLWFCGAWQRYGFHEDGLRSAIHVATALGAEVPWAS